MSRNTLIAYTKSFIFICLLVNFTCFVAFVYSAVVTPMTVMSFKVLSGISFSFIRVVYPVSIFDSSSTFHCLLQHIVLTGVKTQSSKPSNRSPFHQQMSHFIAQVDNFYFVLIIYESFINSVIPVH